METCNHESFFITLPPTLTSVLENFPLITPKEDLDRTIPRCRLCDLIGASEKSRAAGVVFPGNSIAADLEEYIKLTKEMIEEGFNAEESKKELEELENQLNDTLCQLDLKILEAWEEYWAIWGSGEGPELNGEIAIGAEADLNNLISDSDTQVELDVELGIDLDIEASSPAEEIVSPELDINGTAPTDRE